LFDDNFQAGLISVLADSFDDILDVVAPRLSRAVSRAVPEAFARLWTRFSYISSSDFSEDAQVFLKEVVAAAPGLINLKEVSIPDEMEEVSTSLVSLD
jgi:hypothetical protein